MQDGTVDQDGSSQSTDYPSSAGSALDRIIADHAMQLELCDALEFIADSLPSQIDIGLVRDVANVLEHGLSDHFRLEEKELFPLLRRRAATNSDLAAILDQVEKEHERDGDLSSELAEELAALADDESARNAEMLGYMLRGYFASLRRHIEWENALLLPAVKRVLSADELTATEVNPGSEMQRRAWRNLMARRNKGSWS
jgi:hemerythrin-like domain-containing protein